MPYGHNIQIFIKNPFTNIIIIIMTKTALKLILCWALVNGGLADEPQDILRTDAPAPEVANVNFYCTTPGQVFHADCNKKIGEEEGSLTPDALMMDIFNRCVYHETGANLDFNKPKFNTDVPDERKRALRTAATAAAEGANDEVGRSLGYCDACVCSEVCCILGYCGSSCSCTCACERRRLEEENEVLSILQGRQLQLIAEPTEEVVAAVEASCTTQVRTLAILLRSYGNYCLGDGVVGGAVESTDHVTYHYEEITCTPAVISTSHRFP
jgi:hypothetical protein